MEGLFFCLHRAAITRYVWREERSLVATEEPLNICVWLLLKCSEIRANSQQHRPNWCFFSKLPSNTSWGACIATSLWNLHPPNTQQASHSFGFLSRFPLLPPWAAFPSARFCKKMKVTHQQCIHLFLFDVKPSGPPGSQGTSQVRCRHCTNEGTKKLSSAKPMLGWRLQHKCAPPDKESATSSSTF